MIDLLFKLTVTERGLSQVTFDMYFSSNNLKPTESSAVITLRWPIGLFVNTFEAVQKGIKLW